MTLKEKFAKLFMKSRCTIEFEQIADEFAIGFLEWVDDTILKDPMIYYNNTRKKLLEIYKKEKGL